jgi:hypothetical protein
VVVAAARGPAVDVGGAAFEAAEVGALAARPAEVGVVGVGPLAFGGLACGAVILGAGFGFARGAGADSVIEGGGASWVTTGAGGVKMRANES